ncbi:FUSC family protein [Xylophilus sp.]|uniref:FUSC family protein n=1 Tax=Xylophilus sp. TaxID=2653893 RepID=UPI0013BB1A06|nr:FUSC family protein [Xylophilus sp.]KAF1048993.1 MAG: p-hydroxybenzoic acid efflux pump subunit AaeB [Xylophilus sp.]
MNLRWPSALRFSAAEMLFSAKAFAGAVLAMYVASRAGLPRPFWALTTAYVVAHPLAGAVRSKALFRFCGTLVGCTATLLLVPLFANAPELLSMVLALWVAVCLYVSLQDRTPRSYAFMLAGYTAALIGFPTVETPATLFDTAVSRVEEIGLGILCATLVHSLVLPQSLAPSVLGLLDRSLRDARQWLADLFGTGQSPARDAKVLQADRQRLAGDLTQLRLLSTHVPFDTGNLRWTVGAIRAMQDQVAALTPSLSAVEDRLHALAATTADGKLPPDVAAVLAHAEAWLAAKDDSGLAALRTAVAGLGTVAGTDWPQALRLALAQRLDELVSGWHACRRLRRDIDAGLTSARPPRRVAALGDRELHRDRGLALLSAFAAFVVICLCCAVWILTGWPSGSVAAMMAAIFCSFFAAMDDPVPAIHGFLKFTLWSVPISAVYVLVLMPAVHDFVSLVLVCAPTFLLIGCFMARPANFLGAMAMLFGVAGTLALHDTANADLVSFANSMLGQIGGVLAAGRVTRLMRSIGADIGARRIQRATWRELAVLAAAPRLGAGADGYAVRMLDRTGLLAPRIAQAGGSVEGVQADDTLRDLRMGADIVALQRARPALPQAAAAAVLGGIADFFRARAERRPARPPPALRSRIDRLLADLLSVPAPAVQRSAVTALVGLRRNLFPDAPPAFGPTLTSEDPPP